MTTVPPGQHIADVQEGLELRHVRPRDLRGQDVNAQILTPDLEEALQRNVAERGALESVPFCAMTRRGLEIVSGHHRVAAAVDAKIDSIPVLVDTTGLDRSSIAAKQIAHNAIAGEADPQVLAIIAAEISRSDALMESAITRRGGPYCARVAAGRRSLDRLAARVASLGLACSSPARRIVLPFLKNALAATGAFFLGLQQGAYVPLPLARDSPVIGPSWQQSQPLLSANCEGRLHS